MMSLPLEDELEARLHGLEPEGLKVLTFRAMERMVGSAANQDPLVMVCEDLHWADPTSLELLEQLLSLTDRSSLLLICAFRPYTEHGCWTIRETIARLHRHHHTDLWLEALSAADSEELVGNLLEVEALPRPLRRRILDHAEGNPFYVEEVIRSLIDSEILFFDEATTRWQAAREVEDIAIPDTLQGVLMARIDRLEEGARRVLQMASVIGRIFPHRILAAIAEQEDVRPEQGRRALDSHLLTLQREEMIRQRARVPEPEYIFKHHLTQQAAYNGLLRSERRVIHQQAAEALERLFPNRIEEQLGLVAYHWEQAGERQRAIEYLRRAGEQAAAQFANAEAAAYFSRALDLTPEEDLIERYELLLARERAYDMQGVREVQVEDLAALEVLAEALDDDHRRAEVALRQADHANHTDDFPAAIVAARRATHLAHGVGDVTTEAAGYRQWGSALMRQSDYDGSRAKIEQALILARAAHLRRVEGWCLRGLALNLLWRGDLDGAVAYIEQGVSIFQEIGDRRMENRLRIALGLTARLRGDYDQARAYYEGTAHALREVGDRWHEVNSHRIAADVYHDLGDYERAKALYEQSLRSCRDLGRRALEVRVLGLLALLFHHMGDDEAALAYAQQALRLVRNLGARNQYGEALLHQGHALVGLARLDEGRDAYREALALRRELGQPHKAMEVLAGLARVCLAQGDLPQAQAHAEEILSYLETGSLDLTFEPFRIYLTCYRVLEATDDPRARDILEEAHSLLQERAAKISDETERRSFLENVAAHREIVRAYEEGEISVNE